MFFKKIHGSPEVCVATGAATCIGTWRGMAATVLCGVLAACSHGPVNGDPNAGPEAVKRALAGKEIWEEKCRTVAGEKIYRKVENVEGLLLMKIRPQRSEKDLADRWWPEAAFARERRADEYIKSFLGSEYSLDPQGKPVTEKFRGYISASTHSGGLPGYRWVEVPDPASGVRYRYVGNVRVVGKQNSMAPDVIDLMKKYKNYDLNIYGYRLEKAISENQLPRYGVTFEDHVIEEDRYFGIASSTIKVLDLKTEEILGELTTYAWSPSAPSKVNPSPWLTAYRCPDRSSTGTDTRKFVDQVLIPLGRSGR